MYKDVSNITAVYLSLLNLAAYNLPPLLDDVNQDVALLHQFALLVRGVHLGNDAAPALHLFSFSNEKSHHTFQRVYIATVTGKANLF